MSGPLVVDLFCGVGGFSEGVCLGRGRVVLAIDADRGCCEAHALRFPGCVTKMFVIGALTIAAEAELIRWYLSEQGLSADSVHVHASPPCQSESRYNTAARAVSCRHHLSSSLYLTEWSLSLMKELQPLSWSLEQVCSSCVQDLLSRTQKSDALTGHRRCCEFLAVDFSLFGVPQSRTRYIAGPALLVATLAAALPRLRALQQCIPLHVLVGRNALPTGAMIQIGTDNTPTTRSERLITPARTHRPVRAGEFSRPVTMPSYTVTSKGLKVYVEGTGVTGYLTNEQLALLQGFVTNPAPNEKVTRARKMIANAVPPHAGACIIKAAETSTVWPPAIDHKDEDAKEYI
jgi:site-specific DNA-cytosine methylase